MTGAANGVVDDAVRAFAASASRVLVIAPQGTRKPVARFKTGFLRIAKEAGVPLCSWRWTTALDAFESVRRST